MFVKIVGETAGADAFIACDVKILASECAVGEMNSGVGVVHPCAAEAAAPQNDSPIALPTLRIAILATDCEADRGRTLPFPVTEKFIQLPRHKCTKCVWRYCTLYVQAKIGRRIEEISSQLSCLMAHTQVPDERALAVPGEIGSKIGERYLIITELPKGGVPDQIWPKSIRSEIYRAGDFDQRRRVKLDAGEWFAQPESIKKGFQIQAAAQLEIGDVGFAVPISAPRKIALAVAPLAMCDVQVLLIPFASSGQVSHFVAAALQSVAAQRRLYVRFFDFCDVSGELHLQRGKRSREAEFFQFVQYALRNR